MFTPIAKRKNYAVSEIIGGFLLLGIAIVCFSAIYLYVFPLPIGAPPVNVKLIGYVNEEGVAIIEHVGGNTLKNYRLDVFDKTGSKISSQVFPEEEDYLSIGESIEVLPEVLKIDYYNYFKIFIYTKDRDGDDERVFEGVLRGRLELIDEFLSDEVALISSLRTDTIDEDLICFNLNQSVSENASTIIYRWLMNGNPMNAVIMPFDTNNSSICKDYSGNGYFGTILGPEWAINGIRGGGYYFDGGSDKITLDLPGLFDSISDNDFTISIWFNSEDITEDHRTLVQIRKDTKNFVSIFQYGTEMHFGVSQSGIKDATRTESLTNKTWYHLATSWNAIDHSLKIYINGVLFNETGYRNYPYGAHEGIEIGTGTASSRFWWGYIDELLIFDKVISQEQIFQLYMDQKDANFNSSSIVSEETNMGEIWQCEMISNNSVVDGNPIISNSLQIVSYFGG